jgi:endonuclease/exonuclease/phosphatase family metal-dependent hydrolase
MSYNVWSQVERKPRWIARRELIAKVLSWHCPDIIGFQETTLPMIEDLQQRLPAHFRWVGAGRDDGKDLGEFNPIFVNERSFTLGQSSTFWLAPITDTPSRGWGAACHRIVTWVRLVENISGRNLVVFNTHFDHFSRHARRESARLLRIKAAEIGGGDPAILTGDFNARESSQTYRILTGENSDVSTEAGLENAAPFRDALRESASPPYGPRRTWRGVLVGAVGSARIDFIFVKNAVRVRQHAVIADAEYASDHLPVMADLEIG